MQLMLLPLARLELQEARQYYDLQQPGLGQRCIQDFKAAARRIVRWPLACPLERGEIRKCLLERFPYKLLYALRDENILILAVAHQHRQPDDWAERQPQPQPQP